MTTPQTIPGPEPIAVVGVSAIMPDAPDAAAFWANIKAGRYSISDVPPRAVGPRAVLRPRPTRARQDVLAHRRMGPRLRLGAAGVEAADPAGGQRADGRRAEVGGRAAPARRCSTRAGRTGQSTPSGSPSSSATRSAATSSTASNLRIQFPAFARELSAAPIIRRAAEGRA